MITFTVSKINLSCRDHSFILEGLLGKKIMFFLPVTLRKSLQDEVYFLGGSATGGL